MNLIQHRAEADRRSTLFNKGMLTICCHFFFNMRLAIDDDFLAKGKSTLISVILS